MVRSRKDSPKAEQARVRFCIVAIGLRNCAASMALRVRGGDRGSRDICDLSILSPFTFDWNAWSLRLRSSSGSVTDEEFKNEASRFAVTWLAEFHVSL